VILDRDIETLAVQNLTSPMKVAALYDIHGNIDALDAVVEEVRQAQVDLVVIGGDVLPGPMPRETLDRLLELEIPTRAILGNGDRVVLSQMDGRDISEVRGVFLEAIEWTAGQLDRRHRDWLARWPATCQIAIDGLGEVLFCHATPRNDTECFTRQTPQARLRPVFAGVTAGTVVCGHTHMQFDRAVAGVRVVNAGSVGMPFARPPGAYWALLGPEVQLRRTVYDFDHTAERIRRTSFPQAEALAIRYVLEPPDEAESLEMFAGAELG
jgi:putative phosphoesterase